MLKHWQRSSSNALIPAIIWLKMRKWVLDSSRWISEEYYIWFVLSFRSWPSSRIYVTWRNCSTSAWPVSLMMCTSKFFVILWNMFVSIWWTRRTYSFLCFSLVTKGNLQHLQVTDEVLMGLMDYPLDAFEIYIDPHTGVESIRIKSAYRTTKNKIKGRTNKKKTKSKVTRSCSMNCPSL